MLNTVPMAKDRAAISNKPSPFKLKSNDNTLLIDEDASPLPEENKLDKKSMDK